MNKKNRQTPALEPASPLIGVHLDLKGVQPRPAYLATYIADLRAQGVNTVLVEYEDMFPFTGLDLAADRETVWSPALLRRFLRLAAENGIEVIPMQQCLGHLEYLLRWQRYRNLAEDRNYPSTICLAKPQAKALVREMLSQVLAAHPHSRYVHLGMDEAHALSAAARRAGREPLELYAEYLLELCDLVESHGKTPIIFADMLQDHYVPGILDQFRGRVVLGTWNYWSTRAPQPAVRLCGNRTERRWLAEPHNPQAPPINKSTTFIDDLAPEIRRHLEPCARGNGMYDGFLAEHFWHSQGFQVLGHTAVRFSAQGCVLPDCNHLQENISGYAEAAQKYGHLGLIATSWERGNSFCPPNFNIDLTWPLISHFSRAMGGRPRPFWPGIPETAVNRILNSLSRCRKDWRLEDKLAEEMAGLAAGLEEHQHEWESLRLMALTLHLQHRSEHAQLEVDFFHANHRPVPAEWRRRLRDQQKVLRDLPKLRSQVRRHFGRRYHGAAFEEWLRELFDLHEKRLQEASDTTRRKMQLAQAEYSTR